MNLIFFWDRTNLGGEIESGVIGKIRRSTWKLDYFSQSKAARSAVDIGFRGSFRQVLMDFDGEQTSCDVW